MNPDSFKMTDKCQQHFENVYLQRALKNHVYVKKGNEWPKLKLNT